jgi:iron complex transport system substrate-binding protein
VVKDGLGNTITLKAPPKRIVSLAPSITESLFAIGAGKQVVARDDNSKYPEAAAKLPSVGSLWGNFPLEAIVAQQPDLVIAAEITSPDQVKQMQDAGLTVFWMANPKTLDDLYTNLRTLAKITGHEKETQQLIAQLQERVQTVEDALEEVSDEPLVFYELDATDPANPYTAGPGTFISLLIQMAKGKNVGDALDKPWAQISTEALVKQNPDIILLADAPFGVTPEAVAKRAGWGDIKAVKDGKVYPFDPNLLSVPGPRLVDGLETLAVMLHPDVFCAQSLTKHLEQDLVGAVCQP